MDMAVLRRKAIFIPTPGQTEQEYLASRLMEKGIACSVGQGEFNLPDALLKSRNYRGFTDGDFQDTSSYLAAAIDQLMAVV